MIDAFLSYAHEDRTYLALTVRLLEYHRITVRHAAAGSEAGYGDELTRSPAGRLLVMVTAAAVRSRRVARQIAAYRSSRPDPTVVPLLFEDLPAGELIGGLDEHRAIAFFDDLDAGYATLVESFGRPYLPLVERRSREQRTGDRRTLPTVARLRIGMWKNYATATGYGEYDGFGWAVPHHLPRSRDPGADPGRLSALNRLARIFAAEDSELRRYRLLDRSDGTEVRLALDDIAALADSACRELQVLGPLRNVYVVERIAELLCRDYDVQQRDRRIADRRADPRE